MPKSIRKFWGAFQGRVALNYNWSEIDHDSVVIITVSEYNSQHIRFIGAASITVANIAPHGPPFDNNHGVTFVVYVDWGSPLNIVTDIIILDKKPIEIQTYIPPIPINIGLRMQYQESNLWCWIAVGISINHYYDPKSTWTQCMVMTKIGNRINGIPGSSCPTTEVINANPSLNAALNDPYSPSARHILDDAKYNIDRRFLKSGGVTDVLKETGNYDSYHGNNLSLGDIANQISMGRPIVASITWFTGGTHFVAIAGVLGESLLILDPENGQSVIRFGDFPAGYLVGAKLDGYAFSKP